MGFKPFPLETPRSAPWGRSWKEPAKLAHGEFPATTAANRSGVSMRAKGQGARVFPVSTRMVEPEPLVRKAPTQRQLNASYCRFLDEQGWKTNRIANFLQIKPAVVKNIVLMLTFKGRGPLRPPNFEDGKT